MLAHPVVHAGLEVRRKQRVVVDDVQELVRQMDFARAGAGKRVECVRRQRRGAVLDGAGQTVLRARDSRQFASVSRSMRTSRRTVPSAFNEAAVGGAPSAR